MTNTEIIDMLLDDLKKQANPKHKTMGLVNFPSCSMEIWGVSSGSIKGVVKIWKNILHDFTNQQWFDLCVGLCDLKILECQVLAYEFLWQNKKVLQSLSREQVLMVGVNLDNWVSTDCFCLLIAGWHWREGTLADDEILEWTKSKDRWWRRVAVVCTIPLNLKSRGGSGDSLRTLMVCERVIDDRDDMVVKALSWALRELSKTDEPAVRHFINVHSDRLHRRVLREVTAKLETGRKNG